MLDPVEEFRRQTDDISDDAIFVSISRGLVNRVLDEMKRLRAENERLLGRAQAAEARAKRAEAYSNDAEAAVARMAVELLGRRKQDGT